jgi:hypothetical protein
MEMISKLINPILGFILTLVFGFWLSRRGKPYHGLLFNVHKLVALGTVILTAMVVYQASKTITAEILVMVSLLLAAISVVALFVSGALMSAGKGKYRVMKMLHNTAPIFACLGMACMVYLLE